MTRRLTADVPFGRFTLRFRRAAPECDGGWQLLHPEGEVWASGAVGPGGLTGAGLMQAQLVLGAFETMTGPAPRAAACDPLVKVCTAMVLSLPGVPAQFPFLEILRAALVATGDGAPADLRGAARQAEDAIRGADQAALDDALAALSLALRAWAVEDGEGGR